MVRPLAFHHLRSSLCSSSSEENARERNKTMESVRHSKANGFTTTSSTPLLIMRKSIHRVLMASAMRDTDSFKYPRKEEEFLTHLQSWQKTIHKGCIESAFSIFVQRKCLLIILMCPSRAFFFFLVTLLCVDSDV